MSRPSNNPSKNWVFTINNPTQHSLVRPDNINPADPKTRMPVLQYPVYQLEQGEAETPHLQGYLVLKEAQRISYVRKLSPVAHWEIRNGTHQQAKDYCTKSEGRLSEPIEMGEEPRLPGRKQSDDRFANIVKMLKEGATDSLLIDEDPRPLFSTSLESNASGSQWRRSPGTGEQELSSSGGLLGLVSPAFSQT